MTDMFSLVQESQIGHISLADQADLLLVAPATADMIAQMAQGLCSDVLPTVYLATKAPVLVAPSMNVNMWNHSATQSNVELLKKRGVEFVGPDSGELACGWMGEGRLSAPEIICESVFKILS